MKIFGIAKTSTVDYPGKIVTTIFLGGCNFNCEYCHNRQLINPKNELYQIKESDLIEFLKKRKNILEGVCITGGEPTIWNDALINLIKYIKLELGSDFSIKLDTNGSNPEFLRKYSNYFDYIAMDFKTLSYKNNLNFSDEIIMESLEVLKIGNTPYEIRITMYPQYIGLSDLDLIVEKINGVKKVVLQEYKPVSGASQMSYPIKVLDRFKSLLKLKKIDVEIR